MLVTLRRLVFYVVVIIQVGCQSANEPINPGPDQLQSVLISGEGVVELAYVPSEGFSYLDENGELTGVTIELFRDFIRFVNSEYDVNIEIRYNPIESFSDFYEYVKGSEPGVFGVANVTITEERKEELGFSPPYMTNIATLITHSDIEPADGMNQLPNRFEGLDALAFEGTLHEVRLREINSRWVPDAEIHFAHSNREIIERTAEDNRYFAYVDIYNYWRAVEQGISVTRHPAGDEASEEFGVIYPLQSDWSDLLNEFFESHGGYINSDRYRDHMITHLGEELAELLLGQR